MSLTIHRIRTGDALALRETRLAALADDPDAFSSTHEAEVAHPIAYWQHRVDEASAGPHTAVFIAADTSSRWLGLVGGRRSRVGIVDLFSMWVHPSARRRGLGAQLVGAVVDWAQDTGATAVELWVTTGNVAARSLYERCGFEIVDGFVGSAQDPCRDEQRMRRPL